MLSCYTHNKPSLQPSSPCLFTLDYCQRKELFAGSIIISVLTLIIRRDEGHAHLSTLAASLLLQWLMYTIDSINCCFDIPEWAFCFSLDHTENLKAYMNVLLMLQIAKATGWRILQLSLLILHQAQVD